MLSLWIGYVKVVLSSFASEPGPHLATRGCGTLERGCRSGKLKEALRSSFLTVLGRLVPNAGIPRARFIVALELRTTIHTYGTSFSLG